MSGIETRLPPENTRPDGCDELHAAFLQHSADHGGRCFTVGLQLPECSRTEIKHGLALARKRQARIFFVCDTAQQARDAWRFVKRHCPDHRPVALERALAGGWGVVS